MKEMIPFLLALLLWAPPKSAGQEVPGSAAFPEPEKPAVNSGFPTRWKSMTTGSVRILRFEGDYIYGEVVVPEALARVGGGVEIMVKKEGNQYTGTVDARVVKPDGGSACSESNPIELTSVTPTRIEGRAFGPPPGSGFDWSTCTHSISKQWNSFVWIPQSAGGEEQSQASSGQSPRGSTASPQSGKPTANSGFPIRWKSLTTGIIRTLRFEGDLIYEDNFYPDAGVKTDGATQLKFKKNGSKYAGTANLRVVRRDGRAFCPESFAVELTSVTTTRIEGRIFSPPMSSRIDWTTCTYSMPEAWQRFVWVPLN